MTLTFDTHLASLNHLVECLNVSTNFEIIGCYSFQCFTYKSLAKLGLGVK